MATPIVGNVEEDVSKALDRVVSEGERVVLHVEGVGMAALISTDDFALLDELEDRQDFEDAKASLAEPGESITLGELRAEL
jgi:PHD/YefM family antitoxin component YafN of YafNO toxin-antitoxin module